MLQYWEVDMEYVIVIVLLVLLSGVTIIDVMRFSESYAMNWFWPSVAAILLISLAIELLVK
jgi:hypothetical protein